LQGVPACAATNGAQANATQADQPSTEAAVWTQKEVQFTYMGFTTHYSCDGLKDDVREMLLQLGARKDDLKVTEQPCSGDPSRPNPFPGVRIKMSVLTPAPAPLPDATLRVPAQWKTVKLPHRATALDAAGQCELLEQFKHTILPLFSARNVDFRATCVPHQLDALGVKLQADVLIADQKSTTKQASSAETH
jgi:hypothetical protein